MDDYIKNYFDEMRKVIDGLPQDAIRQMVDIILEVRRRKGRLFFLGVGGGAGHCSHAVNDFRKIAGIECYTPTDNVSELTARVNDDGWDTSFSRWLEGSNVRPGDGVFVFSVGGGNLEKNVSANIVNALQVAKKAGAKIIGIVGRDGGYTAQVADACVIVPTVNPETVTPHVESFQAVIWHLIASHPEVNLHGMKWETIK